jgi:hypothetical protein
MSRSIFGWDLPPGCSTKDLPGNQDSDEEAFYDAVYAIFPATLSEGQMEQLAGQLWEMMSKAYSDGYAQGASDTAEAVRVEGGLE